MFIWIGTFVPKEWLVNVFGVADVSSVNVNTSKLPVFDNIHSKKINSLIHLIQTSKRRTMKVSSNFNIIGIIWVIYECSYFLLCWIDRIF